MFDLSKSFPQSEVNDVNDDDNWKETLESEIISFKYVPPLLQADQN